MAHPHPTHCPNRAAPPSGDELQSPVWNQEEQGPGVWGQTGRRAGRPPATAKHLLVVAVLGCSSRHRPAALRPPPRPPAPPPPRGILCGSADPVGLGLAWTWEQGQGDGRCVRVLPITGTGPSWEACGMYLRNAIGVQEVGA